MNRQLIVLLILIIYNFISINAENEYCIEYCSKENTSIIDDFVNKLNSTTKCNETGLHQDTSDLTCTKYHLCLLLDYGMYYRKDFVCSNGTWYNPELKHCSPIYYNCSKSVTVHDTVTGVSFCKTNETTLFTCTEEGIFKNPNDLTCETYYHCKSTTNNTFIQTKSTCSNGTYFDPSLKQCNASYNCPCKVKRVITITTVKSVTTTKPTSVTTGITGTTQSVAKINACPISDSTFTCTTRGRFKIPNDLSCTKYYLCSLLRNGTFIQTEYGCPSGSYFDPSLQQCSALYVCPCTTTTTIKPTTKVTYQTTNTHSVTTIEPCPVDVESNFTCSARGRFRKPKDQTCSKYYLCSLLRNGTFIQTEYGCPSGSYFDPLLQQCSTLYECPCSSTTTIKPTTKVTYQTTNTQSVTTQEPCSIDVEDNFTCSTRGRFRKPNDQTCSKYYLCSLLRNGTFIQTEYGCPSGSYFDPSLQQCSSLYACPCITTTTIKPTTKVTYQTTNTQSVTTQEPCSIDVQDNFTCSARGRFRKPNDQTCSKYYLCSLLRNGTFIQTEYGCPTGSYFDPSLQQCSALYECPCKLTTTTATTIKSTTSATTGVTRTTESITTLDPCPVDVEGNFTCSARGRFRKPNDQTCAKYYLCSLLRNGTFIQTEYGCPSGSYFDQSLQQCSTLYECPCTTSTTTKPTTKVTYGSTNTQSVTTKEPCSVDVEGNFTCSARGRFRKPNDQTCSKYYLCSLLKNGTFIQTEYGCPSGSYFDPSLQQCSTLYKCPCSSTTTTALTTYETTNTQSVTTEYPCSTDPEDNFTCSGKGRFRKSNDLNCTRYYLCSLLRNGTFIQTEYGCPTGSYFDPSLQQCSTLYDCPCKLTTTKKPTTSATTGITSATQSITTSDPCPVSVEDTFTCSERGRFRKPNDRTCTKYYLCSLLRNSSFIQTEYGCPSGSYFDPSLQQCSTLYECPCTSTTTTESTTKVTYGTTNTQRVTTTDAEKNFTCSARGRFRKSNDLSCRRYYLCSLLRNGTFIQTEYGCPNGSYFDPSLQECSTAYECPCKLTTTKPTPSATTGIITTQSITTLNPCPVDVEGNFTCSVRGRYKKPNDQTCTKYYLCSLLKNSSFIQTEYGCPSGSYFDPSLQQCSTLYECPCTSTTTTTLTTYETTNTQSVTTEYPCSINAEDNFTCSAKGRFRKSNDLTCGTYYLCSLLRNGTYIQTEYSCPTGSYFDPSLQQCSVLYECPCKMTTITTIKPTTSVTTGTVTTTQSGTTLDPCPVGVEDTFTCSARGRFRKPNDLSCTKYYLCSLLRNGTFIQTEYGCPSGSYFDPSLQQCSSLYACPCTSTTTIKPSTKVTYQTTNAQSVTTIDPCPVDVEGNFTCSARGRFRKPNDQTCSKYYLCSFLRNGTFIQTEYGCPTGSYFDPSLQQCSTLYECPCKLTTTTETTIKSTTSVTTGVTRTTESITTSDPCPVDVEGNFTCSTRGRFRKPNDQTCSKYYLCSLLRNGTFIQTEYGCPSGSYFDPSLQQCSSLYACPCTATTTIKPTTKVTYQTTSTQSVTTQEPCSIDVEDNFTCSTRGRFRKPNDQTCSKYYLCSLLRNGTFIQTEYGCPSGSYFDPSLQQCSSLYACPCITTTTIKPTTKVTYQTTNTQSVTTQEPCSINVEDNFTCSARGRFKKPNDQTCLKYYLCSLLQNGTFIQTEYGCPTGSYFDPSLQQCSTLYECPCKLATTTIKSTTSVTTGVTRTTESITTLDPCPVDVEGNFTCSARGRFRKPNDQTCAEYYLCSLLRNGTFIQTEYNCPTGSYFDPALQQCSALYECPCPSTTTIKPSTKVTSRPTNSQSVTTKEPCSVDVEDNFTCSARGRFRKPNDQTCVKYYLCSLLRNGTFIQTEYGCPSGSYFDPSLQQCNALYECPCTTTIPVKPTTKVTYQTTNTQSVTTKEPCPVDVEGNFTCSARGRFRKPNDQTCSKYYLCSLLRNGTLIQTEYGCPSGSYFDPSLQQCSTLYECPCTSSTLTRLSTVTTPSTSTALSSCIVSKDEEFTCGGNGSFPKPNDYSCKKYYHCSLLNNGTYRKTEFTCPNNSYFDRQLLKCNVSYKCPCSVILSAVKSVDIINYSTTDISTTTTTTTTTPNPCGAVEITPFKCKRPGRFTKIGDVTCTQYYLCSLLLNGTLFRSQYRCPDGTFFDPQLKHCTVYYNCPCTISAPEFPYLLPIVVDKSILRKTESLHQSPTTTTISTTTCEIDENFKFNCTKNGRFKNPNDLTCKQYYYCELIGDDFKQIEYSCPIGTLFDPSLMMCNRKYSCPCDQKGKQSLSDYIKSELFPFWVVF